MHRGRHPILCDMSLYIYSIWVYRVEVTASRGRAGEDGLDKNTSAHIDIPFDSSYTAARSWTQRLAMEPRIPKVEGFQFISHDTNGENHSLMKSALLRHVYLPTANGDVYTVVAADLPSPPVRCQASTWSCGIRRGSSASNAGLGRALHGPPIAFP